MKKGLIVTLIVILSLFAISCTMFLVSAIANRGKIINDWSFNNMNNNLQVQKEEEFDLTTIKDINITVTSASINILKSENGKLKVVQKSHSLLDNHELFTSSVTEESINISEKNKMKFRFFFFGSFSTSYDIYLPEEYIGNLNIRTASGSIEVATLLNTNTTTLKSTSGSIKILNPIQATGNLTIESTSGSLRTEANLQALSASLKSTSGSIRLAGNTNIQNSLSISTVSGSIQSEGIITCQSAKVSSTSASIRLSSLITETESSLASTSGRIELNKFKGFGKVNTTSASIVINQFDSIGDTNITSVSGRVELLMDVTTNCDIYDKTTSGSVHISNDVRRMGNAPYSIVNIKTTSGSIHVSK